MKFLCAFLLIQSFSFARAQINTFSEKNSYELNDEGDGILVEKFDSTIVDPNKYNQNNLIFKVGDRFKYKFEHFTPNGEKRYFQTKGKRRKKWEFVDENYTDSATVKFVTIEVANGNPMAVYYPNYNQTCLMYRLGSSEKFSISGAIENEANVWIHPPRDNYFRILELNPFPYIKSPFKIGTKWSWHLEIGDSWADKRWKTWKGRIENKYNYEISNTVILETALGEIECYIIKSTANSRIGETKLTSYFNPKYGFIKLEYTNIDGSKTNLEMVEIKKAKSP